MHIHSQGWLSHVEHDTRPIWQKMVEDPVERAHDGAKPFQRCLRAGDDQIETLDHIHARLDGSVLEAYDWPHNLSDEGILERLLALNLERAGGRS